MLECQIESCPERSCKRVVVVIDLGNGRTARRAGIRIESLVVGERVEVVHCTVNAYAGNNLPGLERNVIIKMDILDAEEGGIDYGHAVNLILATIICVVHTAGILVGRVVDRPSVQIILRQPVPVLICRIKGLDSLSIEGTDTERALEEDAQVEIT